MKKRICTALVLLLAICPVAMAEEAGALDYSFNFATTDLDGNIVTSAEIYAGNKITMINFWATWCPPCVGELAELAAVVPGAGERVMHTLMSVMPGQVLKLSVVSTNLRAISLYERLGFIKTAEISRWFQVHPDKK